MGFNLRMSLHALAMLAMVALASVRAQDDMNAAPSPSGDDSYAPPAETSAPDNSAPAPDAETTAPDDSASFQTFYDNLGSQGTWIQSDDYGYIWQPSVTDPDWAPYTEGYWVYTDDGWTWVSTESWGWATYHYGRWVNLDGTGWCWVPGYTWAPAWVSWRYGDDYCGWAPLPPDSFVGIDYASAGFEFNVGFHIGGDCDDFYGIGAGCYHFVPINCLGRRSYRGDYVSRCNNDVIINRTRNVTNINVTRHGDNRAGGQDGTFRRGSARHVTVGGPSLNQVNAVSATPVPRVNLVHSHQPGGGGALGSHSLALYAPRFDPAASENARPARVAGVVGPATINRGTDLTRPLAVNPRLMPRPATEDQVRLARQAQQQAPANAKIVTAASPVTPILHEPLTTLHPIRSAPTASTPNRTIPHQGYPSATAPATPHVYPYPGEAQPGAPSSVHQPRQTPVQEPATPRAYPGQGYPSAPVYLPPSHTPSHEAPAGSSGHPSAPPSYAPPARSAPEPAPRSSPAPASGGSANSGGGNQHGGGASQNNGQWHNH